MIEMMMTTLILRIMMVMTMILRMIMMMTMIFRVIMLIIKFIVIIPGIRWMLWGKWKQVEPEQIHHLSNMILPNYLLPIILTIEFVYNFFFFNTIIIISLKS